ncbi:MAG: ArsA-related P-loop ATPase [Acidimicrobiia bacterium]|nr:ArsA-related P-loop ATPase [Acidimicrobiia bacterium]
MFDRKLVIVSGKGGVGKSAVAASLALHAARRGKRVLCIGMTDAIGLATHFGVQTLTYEPRRVHAGIDAIAIDRVAALDEYLHIQLRVPKAAPLRQFTKFFEELVDTAPGIREIITMGKPLFETWRTTYDRVIVDAPPIGQLISYLRAPITVANVVPTGAVRDEAMRMRMTLADSAQAGLLIVTMPEELPVVETIEALNDMGDEALIDLLGIVINRVIYPLNADDDAVGGLEDGPLKDAAVLHQQLAEEQHRWLELLPDGPRLPHLFGLLTPGEIAAALSERWDEL